MLAPSHYYNYFIYFFLHIFNDKSQYAIGAINSGAAY